MYTERHFTLTSSKVASLLPGTIRTLFKERPLLFEKATNQHVTNFPSLIEDKAKKKRWQVSHTADLGSKPEAFNCVLGT